MKQRKYFKDKFDNEILRNWTVSDIYGWVYGEDMVGSLIQWKHLEIFSSIRLIADHHLVN